MGSPPGVHPQYMVFSGSERLVGLDTISEGEKMFIRFLHLYMPFSIRKMGFQLSALSENKL